VLAPATRFGLNLDLRQLLGHYEGGEAELPAIELVVRIVIAFMIMGGAGFRLRQSIGLT